MFLWEGEQKVLGILRSIVGGLTILSPKQVYFQWIKVRINNVCGQSTYVCSGNNNILNIQFVLVQSAIIYIYLFEGLW
jgi:hypothetical protein